MNTKDVEKFNQADKALIEARAAIRRLPIDEVFKTYLVEQITMMVAATGKAYVSTLPTPNPKEE